VNGHTIDHAMVVFHPAPHSYTGQDLAEIGCHGNPIIVTKIMEAIRSTRLARLAGKGEFTKRAFLNGKMDLAQAEAVGALINAKNPLGIDMASSLLQGSLSTRIKKICDNILDIISTIEASFIVDDEDTSKEDILAMIQPLINDMEDLLKDKGISPVLYDGIHTTIAGMPNAGKSSLFNAILGYERAIVHEEKGTTRDIIIERITHQGIDFIFHDTAGIRETPSGPEKIGVEKTIDTLKQSDLVLYVVDALSGLQPEEAKWLSLGKKSILVINKIDLADGIRHDIPGISTVNVSAKYAQGMADLFKTMEESYHCAEPKVFIDRHVFLIEQALSSLIASRESIDAGMTDDVLTIDLNKAVESLMELLGDKPDQKILERIFSRFCVGK